jgi:hypothetical protein
MYKQISVRHIAILLFAGVLVCVATMAEAHGDPNHLRGEYAFSATTSFATDPVGWTSNLAHIGNGTTNNAHVGGILVFNGDGTGTQKYQLLRINRDSNGIGQQPVEHSEVNCTLTYTVNNDHVFTVRHNCTGTVLNGFAEGQTFTLIFQTQGAIGQDGKVLVLYDTTPNAETLTRSTGVTINSIVGRSGVAVKMK